MAQCKLACLVIIIIIIIYVVVTVVAVVIALENSKEKSRKPLAIHLRGSSCCLCRQLGHTHTHTVRQPVCSAMLWAYWTAAAAVKAPAEGRPSQLP